MGPPPVNYQWVLSGSDEDDCVYIGPQDVYSKRAKILVDLLNGPAKANTKRMGVLRAGGQLAGRRQGSIGRAAGRTNERASFSIILGTFASSNRARVLARPQTSHRRPLRDCTEKRKGSIGAKDACTSGACAVDIAKWNM